MKFSAMISAAALFAFAAATPLAAAEPVSTEVEQYTAGNTTISKRQTRFGTIQFFSGNACDGGVGGVVNINDRDVQCIDATNRHSVKVQGCRAYISFFERGGCPGNPYAVTSFNAGTCTNINTGRPWGSSKVYCPYNQ